MSTSTTFFLPTIWKAYFPDMMSTETLCHVWATPSPNVLHLRILTAGNLLYEEVVLGWKELQGPLEEVVALLLLMSIDEQVVKKEKLPQESHSGLPFKEKGRK